MTILTSTTTIIIIIKISNTTTTMLDNNTTTIIVTSAITIIDGEAPADAFRLDDVHGVAVVSARAEGQKCARSWRYSTEVGTDKDYPDVTLRDAAALRERDARAGAAH